METKPTQRRYDLDWLRVLAILSVFLYHSTRFFNLGGWHVKNAMTYASVEVLERFMEIWMMPLVFLISGASIYYAMNKGGAGTFFKDKVLRLLIPLIVAMFTYASLQVYLERITHGQFSGSYFAFLPHYFEGFYLDVGSTGNFAIHGMHMWYVMILFIYCLIFYPLLRWWKGCGRGVLDKLGNLLAFPWTMWLAMALPILLLHAWVSDSDLEFGAGGWPFVYYIFFLLYGFLVASNERLEANVKRMRWFNLALGALFSSAFVILIGNPALAELEDALGDLFWILSACTLVPAILGFGMKHLTKNAPFLNYAGEAVMGFYILHQTVLLVVGYFVVQWDISALAKWAVISTLSFGIIMALYEYLIRRMNVLRFLCGMKTIAKPAKMTATEPVLANAKPR